MHDQSIKVRDQNIKFERHFNAEISKDAKACKQVPENVSRQQPTAIEVPSKSNEQENFTREQQSENTVKDVEEPVQAQRARVEQIEETEAADSQPENSNEDVTLESMNISEQNLNETEEQGEDNHEVATVSCKEEPAESPISDQEKIELAQKAENCVIEVAKADTEIDLTEVQVTAEDEHLQQTDDHSNDEEYDENEDLTQENKPQIKEEYQDYHSMLFDILKVDSKKAKKQQEPKVELELSTNILSYERFFPGRILGNTFTIRNVGEGPAHFSLNFENANLDNMFVGEKLCDYFGVENINEIEKTYTKHLTKEFFNTPESLAVWFIEDPYTKTLIKKVDMTLEPGEGYEFIIVLKSPVINKQILYGANVVVKLRESSKSQKSSNANQNLSENDDGNSKYTMSTNSRRAQEDSKYKVFCFGCMESLKVSCPKEMYNTQLGAKLIKVVMRRKQGAMPIKVLLENKGDMEVNASVQSVEMEKDMQFYIPNKKVHIDPNGRILLEIKAINKLEPKPAAKKGKKSQPEIIHKLVIAKVKDCELKFSLTFEITII